MRRRFMLASVRFSNSRSIPAKHLRAKSCVPLKPSARLSVPVNALLFRSEGLRAVVVDANHKVHLKALTIGRDYGTALEVLQGLEESDWIVLNPADSLDEGQEVHVKETAVNAGIAPGKPQETAPGSNKQ